MIHTKGHFLLSEESCFVFMLKYQFQFVLKSIKLLQDMLSNFLCLLLAKITQNNISST